MGVKKSLVKNAFTHQSTPYLMIKVYKPNRCALSCKEESISRDSRSLEDHEAQGVHPAKGEVTSNGQSQGYTAKI